jgi:cytochrome b561
LVVQAFLYLSLLALIATGIAAAAPRPFTPPIQLFGLWPLPKIVGALPTMVRNMPGIHAALVWILLGLVGFHVAAAIYGTLIARERTIFRMLVWPKHR